MRQRDRAATIALAALAAAVTLAALWPLLTTRVLAGHRPEYHVLRVLLVADACDGGQLIPRWVPSLAGGLGYPLFIYYSWLSYALAAALHVLGLAPATAVNVVTFAAALAGSAGVFVLGRQLGGRAGGFLAWALFAFAPYQLVNLYVRGNFPELVASAFAPWALWAMVRTARGSRRGDLVWCAVLLAAIPLSHNISGATLGTTVVASGLLIALTLPGDERKPAVLRVLAAAAAAVLLCAFFWGPILAQRNAVSLTHDFDAYLDYRQHFLEPAQLVATGWGYGYSVPGPGDTMPLQLGIPQVAVLVGLVPLALGLAPGSTWRRRVRLVGFATAGLVLALLTIRWAAPVWTLVGVLGLVQFPWRLHLPGTLLVAVTAALAVRPLMAVAGARRDQHRRRILLAALVAVGLAAAWLPRCRPLTTYDCGEACVRSFLGRGYYTTCTQDEFRPAAATDLRALGNVMLAQQATLDGVPAPEIHLPPAAGRLAFTFDLHAGRAAELALPVFWFAGWRLTVDGHDARPYACRGTGVLCAAVPAGSHTVTAAWRPTFVYHASAAVSLAMLAGLLVWSRRRRRRPTLPSSS